MSRTTIAASIFVLVCTITSPAFAGQPPDVVQSDANANTAMGTNALLHNTGCCNTAAGDATLYNNTSGGNNTAFGTYALNSNQTGSDNSAFGYNALAANNASGNAAFGFQALSNNTSGYFNAAFGYQTLLTNTNGSANAAFGYQALLDNNGDSNTAFGIFALSANAGGSENTAVGYAALTENTNGVYNTAVGYYSAFSLTSGSGNIVLGYEAGTNLTSGNNNIDIGNPGGSSAESGTIRIGTQTAQTATYIAGITATTVTGSAVYVTSTGQLGVLASSERYKTDVIAMGTATEKLNRLRPVTFKLRADPQGTVQYGLIAEEVDKVYPELVTRDAKGRIEGIRYEELAPMLLNDVQQMHQKLSAQAQQIRDMQLQLAELMDLKQQLAHLRELNRATASRTQLQKPRDTPTGFRQYEAARGGPRTREKMQRSGSLRLSPSLVRCPGHGTSCYGRVAELRQAIGGEPPSG